ncbi:MAG: AAA family ATPase [Candidatus Vogelbacteria bacterium]|nr:AAA family ATPase [Candidatus Vogelbacteria bacterium]
MKLVRNRYKGVVFFGEPGSGKTTAAKVLTDKVGGCELLEASLVLKFALSLKQLPKTKGEFIARVDDGHKDDVINRDKAREIFSQLTQKYSKTIVAESMNALVDRKYKDKFVVIAGARALDAAKFYKLNNFLIIYLECPRRELIGRLKSRQKSEQEVKRELRHEEEIYQTKKIKKVADLVLDSFKMSPDQIANALLDYLQSVC